MPTETSTAFVSAPCLFIKPLRRPRVRSPRILASAGASEEDFFLPAERRTDLHRKVKSPAKQSISQQRARQKREEKIKFASVEEKDAVIREQIINEEISSADLFGLSDDTSGILNTNDIIYPNGSPHSSSSSTTNEIDSSFTSSSVQDLNSSQLSSESTEKKRKKHGKKKNLISTENSLPLNRDTDLNLSQKSKPESATSNGKDQNFSVPFINIGDLINHERHGIGRFLGLERTHGSSDDSSFVTQEFAVIEYRDGDVFVPLGHFDLIRRMSDDEAKRVTRLDVITNSATFAGATLSNSRNRRSNFLARQRTREKIRRQIVNLHAMYARRSEIEREQFSVDEEAENRFSDLCNFDLTSDQKDATSQILSDMSEKQMPMDRLLCGDVGFGKTEVAMRAACRAINAGKQVVVMAPTTILSQQHFETFSHRLNAYDPDIKIACFNRFAPRKVIEKARREVADDIIKVAIGTHMLLSDRMSFPNLGLLIIDEEHRFGVNQKEKIRARYEHVDTLLLSATPIPRTLHLSLSGLRDASVLRTPPIGRKPVITRVVKAGSGVVRNAIQKELDRDGQVFFVVPRVEGIEAVAEWIEDLFDVGEVRVLIAHGSSTDLEQRIWSFAQREYDVLLCTTVIENGIDMPSVNTIIIQDASRFGLAQLHQLRGRVGRGDVQAYAWILYQDDLSRLISMNSKLKALEENSHLGAGFAIAQRDMEMRGVGTVLGVEQHGNNSIGAEEYARMLAEELESVRTGKPVPMRLPVTHNVEVILAVASFIPNEYVNNFEEKMGLYKRMSDCRSHEELDALARHLERTYGEIPNETRKHLSIIKLKVLAKFLGIKKIWAERQHVILDWAIEGPAFNRLVKFLPDKASRDRCEHIEVEERVVIRGLGILTGDVQLVKLFVMLEYFAKAAEGFARDGEGGMALGDTLARLTKEKNAEV